MSEWQGYKGTRKPLSLRLQEMRLNAIDEIDVPLLWLLTWDDLTAAQRYKITRNLL